MIEPDKIIRSFRRSLCLKIDKDAKLIVYAPMRLSINKINEYIIEKEKWIKTKQSQIEKNLSINKNIITYKEILFLGKKYTVIKNQKIKKIELSNEGLLIPDKFDSNEINQKIKLWYISNAKKILPQRLEYFANIMQIDYANVSICNSKTKWGSCDFKRNIKLNYRLIMLPHKVLDYVLIHELSHIIEFNHSKQFYKIISLVMPSYKLQQKILKEYDYTLHLFR